MYIQMLHIYSNDEGNMILLSHTSVTMVTVAVYIPLVHSPFNIAIKVFNRVLESLKVIRG